MRLAFSIPQRARTECGLIRNSCQSFSCNDIFFSVAGPKRSRRSLYARDRRGEKRATRTKKQKGEISCETPPSAIRILEDQVSAPDRSCFLRSLLAPRHDPPAPGFSVSTAARASSPPPSLPSPRRASEAGLVAKSPAGLIPLSSWRISPPLALILALIDCCARP